MSFVSLVFWLFLPLVFALYYACQRRQWQNVVLLAASYVFYGWWDYRFCALMLFSSVVDYGVGLAIHRSDKPGTRRALLAVGLCVGLGVLAFFKYFNFFVDSLAILLSTAGIDINTTSFIFILPAGISFYTFQTLSYTIDVYRRKLEPTKDLCAYLTFVAFFPHLVAGPIQRATHLLPQFLDPRRFSLADAREGCRFILWGLLKKLVLADNLAQIVNSAYAAPQVSSGSELLLATVFFGFQIYCDFSAYSDLATGLAKLFGIQFTRNFAYPYFSQSPSEFWRRWHISLSTWFRDYVFVPLGGSRGSGAVTTRNLLLTSLLSGLWHGASWNFVAWGGIHGLYLVAARFMGWTTKPATPDESPAGPRLFPGPAILFRVLATFLLVNAAWVLFRSGDLTNSIRIYEKIGLGLLTPAFYQALLSLLAKHALVGGLLAAFVAIEWIGRGNWNTLCVRTAPLIVRWMVYTSIVWLLMLLGARTTEEFIYFQF
jgi:D-alanyl-lipoteichoic acid acyltransferase DltB (MBOAT superfamily)